jgi:hypothetical protein
MPLRPRMTVDRHRSGVDQPFGGRPRPDLGERGEEAIEALARRSVRDAS